MSPQEREAEVKHVKSNSKADPGPGVPRDPTMVEGERSQSPEEKQRNKEERERPKEAPIIQKDVT